MGSQRSPHKEKKAKKIKSSAEKSVPAEIKAVRANPPHPASAHPILTWIRGAVGPAVSLVGVRMIFSSFTVGVCLIYGGGLICLIELLFNPWTRQYSIWDRFIGITTVLCLLTMFSEEIVFINAPLDTMATIHRVSYAPGTIIAGIKWRPEFADLRLSLINNTDNDYKEVDIYVEPDEPIVLIGQLSNVLGVSFIGDLTKEQTLVGEATFGPPSLNLFGEAGHLLTVPINVPMTQASAPRYRVRCQSIIKKSGIELVLAIAGVDCNKTQCLKITWTSDDGSLRIPSPTLIPSADYNTNVFVRKQPSQVKIYGTYMGGEPSRTKSINETVFINEPVRIQ
jgi:hypothetical protein